MGAESEKKLLETAVKKYDTDDDGILNSKELIRWLTSSHTHDEDTHEPTAQDDGVMEEMIAETMQDADTDNDGKLTLDEIVEMEMYQNHMPVEDEDGAY